MIKHYFVVAVLTLGLIGSRVSVRGSNEKHSLFLPLILTFSRREKARSIVPA
jgi:hypothetical protein